MSPHGTANRYQRGGCRCDWCREARRLYSRGEIAYSEQIPVTVGLVLNGPDKGYSFTGGGVVVNLDGRRYVSHLQIEPFVVGYIYLGADA